jgi:phosphohistidine phosphatase SixA
VRFRWRDCADGDRVKIMTFAFIRHARRTVDKAHSLSVWTEPAALVDRTLIVDDPRARGGGVVIESRILFQFGRVALCVLAISLVITPGLAADDSKEAWAALVTGGHVALIRHGNAPPGYGDPPGFKIDDCQTQRNLDELGREQARALGETFRNHGVRVDRILSSPWCRCLETGRLMAVGPVETSWALVPDREPSVPVRLRELKEMVSAWRGPGTLVLVTHAFTVRALLGFLPTQGETVVLKPGSGNSAGVDLVGLIATPQ